MPQGNLKDILSAFNECMEYEGKFERILDNLNLDYRNATEKKICGNKNRKLIAR